LAILTPTTKSLGAVFGSFFESSRFWSYHETPFLLARLKVAAGKCVICQDFYGASVVTSKESASFQVLYQSDSSKNIIALVHVFEGDEFFLSSFVHDSRDMTSCAPPMRFFW
jgi:hypothetical protein